MRLSRFEVLRLILLMIPILVCKETNAQEAEKEQSYAQNFTYHSPTAFSFSKINNTPFNPFTGQLKLNLALLEKKMSFLNFEMKLNYTGGGGLKVNDPRTIVGKGWLLNVGGAIVRNKRGVPDDFINQKQYFGSVPTKYNGILFNNGVNFGPDGETTIAYNNEAFSYSNGTADSQHDIFEFNFFGTSGKFYIGKDLEVKVVTDSKIQIIPDYNGTAPEFAIGSFKIIDESGIKYTFSSIEFTMDGSLTNIDEENIKYFGKWCPSSWLLTKVESPFNEETIVYDYIQLQGLNAGFLPSGVYEKRSDWEDGSIGGGGLSRDEKELQIKSITFSDNTHIDFHYFTKLGSDFPLLKGIQMISPDDHIVKAYSFNYKAWVTATKQFYTSACPTDCPSLFDYNYYLKDVSLLGNNGSSQMMYELDYFLGENYNESSQPNYGIDFWGYYNGKNNATLFRVPTQWSSEPADRNPVLEYARIGAIKEIIYGTGGSEEFDYELNAKRVQRFINENVPVGGIRLKRRILHDGIDPEKDVIKEYQYIETDGWSSGFLGEFPQNTFVYNVYHDDGGWPNSPNLKYTITKTFSYAINPLSSVDGNFVGYRRVEELWGSPTSSLGKIVYEYTDLTSLNFWRPNDYYPYRPIDRPYWAVGLPLKTTYVNAGGLTTKEIINEYDIVEENNQTPEYRSLHIEKKGEIDIFQSGGNELRFIYKFTNYYPVTGRAELIATHESTYSTTTPQTITTTSSYRTYDPDFFCVRNIEATDSKGYLTKEKFYYPFDFNTGTGPFALLTDLNVLKEPVLTETWLSKSTGSYLVASQVTDYKIINGQIINGQSVRPASLYKSQLTNSLFSSSPEAFNPTPLSDLNRGYKLQAEFTGYDSKGRLVELTEQGKVKTSVILDNSGNVIAKGENIAYNNFAFSNFESSVKGNWTYSESSITEDFAKVGKRSFNGVISKTGLNQGNFFVAFWARGSSAITINGSSQSVGSEWKFYKVALSNISSVSINTNGSFVDEVVLFVEGGNFTTISYNDGVGISTTMDKNGKITFYDYDEFNRLRNIKDHEGNIIKSYSYHFIEPPFKSVSVSKTFLYDNVCEGGSIPGDPVTYTVPAGRYTSYLSQADADANALSDIDVNGQRYANENGGCVAIYYNTAVSAPFSKNDCAPGTVTFPVYYYIPAQTYSSLVSQADADLQAQNDISQNGQNHANETGVCRVMIEVNLWNSTTTTFQISFSGLGTQFSYPPGSSKLQIPQGVYTVHIEDPASGTYTYWIGSRSSKTGSSANFSNVNIAAGSDDRNVNISY